MEAEQKIYSHLSDPSVVEDEFFYHTFSEVSPLQNCLRPLLESLEWPGSNRQLQEVLPHLVERLDLQGFLRVLRLVNFSNKHVKANLKSLDSRLLPCLFVTKSGEALVILKRDGATLHVYNGVTKRREELSAVSLLGVAYYFEVYDKGTDSAEAKQARWFKRLFRRFRGLYAQVLIVSFFTNILALAPPFFLMVVFDRVITTGSIDLMFKLAIGAVIALFGTVLLNRVKRRTMAYAGARLDLRLGNAVMERLLFIPAKFIEGSTIGSQVARIKDFNRVRDFFTGPLMNILFDLPFVIVFLIAIGFFAGKLVLIPLVSVVIFVIFGVMFHRMMRNNVSDSAESNSTRQKFSLETLLDMRIIKYSSAEKIWAGRFQKMTGDVAANNYRSSMFSSITGAISDGLMMLTGLAVLGFGAVAVVNGELSMGALIALMIVIWRILGPFKALFMMITAMDSIRASMRQVRQLLSIRPETTAQKIEPEITDIDGRITFLHVTMRYTALTDPALMGINFTVKPGSVTAITGLSGSGKSTLLKLILGLYKPQAGMVRIDDRDIRQMDPIELRHAIAYVAQAGSLFYGTIRQNMRLANPTATDVEIMAAMQMADVADEVLALPDGLDTQLRDLSHSRLPVSLQQRLLLAQAFVKKAKILLLDEVSDGFDYASDEHFVKMIERLKGKVTVLMVTQRPSQMKIADQVMVMRGAQIVAAGAPEKIVPEILGELNSPEGGMSVEAVTK